METLAKAEKFIESHLSTSTKRNRGEEFEPGGSADCFMIRIYDFFLSAILLQF